MGHGNGWVRKYLLDDRVIDALALLAYVQAAIVKGFHKANADFLKKVRPRSSSYMAYPCIHSKRSCHEGHYPQSMLSGLLAIQLAHLKNSSPSKS
jgi:hypothetical protein